MLNLRLGPNQNSIIDWTEGKSLNDYNHRATQEIHHNQYSEISNRVQALSKSSLTRVIVA
jgi:hypothetical protein